MPYQPGKNSAPTKSNRRFGAPAGLGQVYKARDRRLNRIVAIKTANEKFSERFEHEDRAIAALNQGQ